jgi:hypothetical protein
MLHGPAVALALVPLLFPTAQESAAPADDVAALWADGQAEVHAYRWRGTRKGAVRQGEIVATFLTQQFAGEQHVVLDRPANYEGQVLTALRFNTVRSFQTGVSDERTVTTVFVRADDLAPLRFTFSASDWNGHVYEDIDANLRAFLVDVRSPYQDESGKKTLPRKPDGLIGDQLLVWMRGLRGAPIEPGATKTLPLVADAFERRMRHSDALWTTATIARDAANAPHEVPAGTFDAICYRIRTSDARVGEVWVEAASPHRILSWKWMRLEELLDSAELTGSVRTKYWEELDDAEHDDLRAALGLER